MEVKVAKRPRFDSLTDRPPTLKLVYLGQIRPGRAQEDPSPMHVTSLVVEVVVVDGLLSLLFSLSLLLLLLLRSLASTRWGHDLSL